MQKMKLQSEAQTLSKKFGNYTAVATATALPALAMANDLTQPDVSQIVTYIGYATGAIVAIGTAKMIPAVAIWLYTKLSNMASRG